MPSIRASLEAEAAFFQNHPSYRAIAGKMGIPFLSRMLNEMFVEAVPVILHEDDLNAMYFSMENRSPFLDRFLFEFAYSIPTSYLIKNGFINDDWNALNILHRNASSVGALDMGLIENTPNKESFFSNLNNKKFKFLYLLGSDNIKINKDDMFIVYQGSHGDRSAEIADVILPGSAYTEQNGLYANLEGRVQECKKASYPPGLAKEDYQILNELNLQLFNKKLFNKFGDIRNEAVNKIANFSGYENLPKKISLKSNKIINEFFDEELKINKVDYYFTNSISRSSKTMSECREARMKSKI